jgi:uncharacterized protein YyaL (SSP411 family)
VRALGILEFIWRDCRTEEDGVFHYYDGAPRLAGLLEDQVRVGTALIQAHLANGDAVHLDGARQTADWIIARVKNPAGGYFDSAAGEIALRKLPLTDLDQNGAAASFFLRLARVSGEAKYKEAARWALDAFNGDFAAYGIHSARFGKALLDDLSP